MTNLHHKRKYEVGDTSGAIIIRSKMICDSFFNKFFIRLLTISEETNGGYYVPTWANRPTASMSCFFTYYYHTYCPVRMPRQPLRTLLIGSRCFGILLVVLLSLLGLSVLLFRLLRSAMSWKLKSNLTLLIGYLQPDEALLTDTKHICDKRDRAHANRARRKCHYVVK